MGKILLNAERRLEVTSSICDKLYEWFGDITYITGVCDRKGIMRIYFDNKKVGTFDELYAGIKKLFFDESDSIQLKKLKYKLEMRLQFGRRTEIIDIARLIVKYKTIMIKAI